VKGPGTRNPPTFGSEAGRGGSKATQEGEEAVLAPGWLDFPSQPNPVVPYSRMRHHNQLHGHGRASTSVTWVANFSKQQVNQNMELAWQMTSTKHMRQPSAT